MWKDIVATIIGFVLSMTGAVSDQASHVTDKLRDALMPAQSETTKVRTAAATSLPLLPEPKDGTKWAEITPTPSLFALAQETAVAGQTTATPTSPDNGSSAQTIINQPVIERTIERVVEVPATGYVTHSQLLSEIAALKTSFGTQLYGPSYPAPPSTANDGGLLSVIGMMGRIDNLSGTNLTSITVNGVSGLTDADIPDSLTANNYLPLTGGTLTGDLTMSGTLTAGALSVSGISSSGALIGPYVQATSTTATSTFAGGITGPNSFTVQSSSGRVGIGTTTPGANLVVNGTTGQNLFQIASSTNQSIFLINQSGQTGIGIVPGNVTAGDALQVASYNAITANAFRSTLTITDLTENSAVAAGSGPGLRFQGQTNFGATTMAGIWAESEGNSTDGSLYFTTRGPSGSSAADVAIKSTGNLGIASTTPWRTLSVTGTVGFDGLTGATGAGSLCLDSNKQVVYNSASDNCLSSTRATKHAIEGLSLDGLRIIDALQPVSFVYNEGDGRTRYGFIAEDTAAVDAHLATYNASGTVSGIDDRSILAIVVGAIKDLASKVSETAHLVIDTLTARRGNFSDQLCVGSTCVTEEQFEAVFGNQPASAVQATAGASPRAAEEAPVGGVVRDGVTAPVATSTAPADSSPPEDALSPANDNEPATSIEEQDDDAQEEETKPNSEPQVTPTIGEHPTSPQTEPANDNSPLPSAEAM
jgi:hypothetical protein